MTEAETRALIERLENSEVPDELSEQGQFNYNLRFAKAADALTHWLERALSAEAALKPFSALTPSSIYPADGSENEGYGLILDDYHHSQHTKPDFTGQDLATARAHFEQYGEGK